MTSPNVFLSYDIIEWQRRQAQAAGRDPAAFTHGQSRYLRMKEVIGLCGLSERSIYRGIAADKFPRPIKLKLS
jgi:Prophage CP4-57 regulatory protein (AlpA)